MARLVLHAFKPPAVSHRGTEGGTWQPNNQLCTRSIYLFCDFHNNRMKHLTLGVTHFSFLAPEGRSARALRLQRAGSRIQCSWKSKEACRLLARALCRRARLRLFRK